MSIAPGGVAREGSYDDACPQRVVLLGAVAHMTGCFYNWIIIPRILGYMSTDKNDNLIWFTQRFSWSLMIPRIFGYFDLV